MDEIYALCRLYGPLLHMPAEINGPKFMAAIAWNESSCGKNLTPRYEAAYDFGGRFALHSPQMQLLEFWKTKAAYRNGPWMMLPCQARGFTPEELFTDTEKCAQAFMAFFNRFVITQMHADTFDRMAQCYSAGYYAEPPLPTAARYVEDALHHYMSVDLMATEVPSVAPSGH